MYDEILEQPVALPRALAGGRTAVAALVADAKKRDVRYLVLAARGTSDNAAAYAKYLLQIVCGLPVALAAPSVHTLYGADVDYKGALVIGVSQSGAGADICEVIARARKAGALTAALTNTADSALAGEAQHLLPCGAGVENAVAATKTYTATLALFALLAAEWRESRELREGLARLGDAASLALLAEPRVRDLARTLIHAERILCAARGLHLCTANEAALKIAETSRIVTQSFSSADLLHGPIASVAFNTPCLLFRPKGRTAEGISEVAGKLREKGARVLLLAGNDQEETSVPLADPGTELLSPIIDILPAQLLAHHLTVARGLDPDHPPGLTKVTVTR